MNGAEGLRELDEFDKLVAIHARPLLKRGRSTRSRRGRHYYEIRDKERAWQTILGWGETNQWFEHASENCGKAVRKNEGARDRPVGEAVGEKEGGRDQETQETGGRDSISLINLTWNCRPSPGEVAEGNRPVAGVLTSGEWRERPEERTG